MFAWSRYWTILLLLRKTLYSSALLSQLLTFEALELY